MTARSRILNATVLVVAAEVAEQAPTVQQSDAGPAQREVNEQRELSADPRLRIIPHQENENEKRPRVRTLFKLLLNGLVVFAPMMQFLFEIGRYYDLF